jgi:GNAT superfamily N-acetyltransferase
LSDEILLELFRESYLATPRQRRIGERRQVGPITCVHYDYYWGGSRMQADNFFVSAEDDLPTVLEAIQRYGPAEENQIVVPMIDLDIPIIMVGHGCEDRGVNYLMERPTADPDVELVPDILVHQVTSPKDVGLYNSVFGGSLALRADAANIDFRYYYILDGEKPAAQGRSWRCRPTISWESQIYTDPNFQRRGFGKALIQQILRHNAEAGIAHSVLLATEAGHRLYRRVGYIDRMAYGCYKWQNER